MPSLSTNQRSVILPFIDKSIKQHYPPYEVLGPEATRVIALLNMIWNIPSIILDHLHYFVKKVWRGFWNLL